MKKIWIIGLLTLALLLAGAAFADQEDAPDAACAVAGRRADGGKRRL